MPDGKAISKTGLPYPDFWSPVVKDTSSWRSISKNHLDPIMGGMDLDIKGNPFGYILPESPASVSAKVYSAALPKSYIDQFGGGKFFYNGWETNPFNSNLI